MSLDDFALRKRHTYGTLLINLENGKCVDMIETRDVEEVSKWLMTFPNIELVSGDGSTAYKKAITTSHPQAIQITDRFHLIKGLSEYAKSELERLLPKLITLKRDNLINEPCIQPNTKTTLSKPYLKKLELIDRIKKHYETCRNLTELSRVYNVDRRTITMYVRGILPIFSKSRSRPLDVLKEDIKCRIKQKQSIRNIHNYVIEQGIKKSYSNLKDYVNKIKLEIPHEVNVIKISRHRVIKLLFNKGIADLGIKQEQQTEIKIFLKRNKAIQEIIDLVTQFRNLLLSKNIRLLEAWMLKVLSSNYENLKKFVQGTKRDIEAVVSAILCDYSNGKIEGKINKLKKIKREMYGRCSFELLKNKFF